MKLYLLVIMFLALPTLAHAKLKKETETLTNTLVTNIKKDGSAVEQVDLVQKVLTEAGRTKLSILKVNYYRSLEAFLLVEAYTLTNGKKSVISGRSIRVTNADRVDHGLSDLMEVAIPFDNITVGTEVHLRYNLLKNHLSVTCLHLP